MAKYKTVVTADELAKLPDPIKEIYVERNGKIMADLDEVDGVALEDVRGLRGTVESLRGEKRTFTEKLAVAETAKQAAERSAAELAEQMKTLTPAQAVEERIKSERAALAEKHSREIAAAKAETEENNVEVRRLLIDVEARRILSGADGKPIGSYALLAPIIAASTRVEKDPTTGKRVTKVLDKNGNPRITNQKGKDHDMELEEYIVDVLKPNPEYAPAFFGSQASGAGTRSPDAVRSPQKTVKTVNRNDVEGMGDNLEGIADGSVVVIEE